MEQTRTQRRANMNPNAEATASAGGDPPTTRMERRKQQEQQAPKRRRTRLIPIWLRLIIIIVLLAFSLLGGAMVGYSAIGNGNLGDVFHKSTWEHPFDIVYKNKQ